MLKTFVILSLFAIFWPQTDGLGCLQSLCQGQSLTYRSCHDAKTKQTNEKCGRYHSARWNGRLMKAIDFLCETDTPVLAPFDAKIEAYSVYKDGSDWDQGLMFTGTGQWSLYKASILHFKPRRTSGEVKKGEVVGVSINVENASPQKIQEKLIAEGSDNFIQFALRRDGKRIDPTSHFFDCRCTGMICESNPSNTPIGAYKTHETFEGFEVLCKDNKKKPGQSDDAEVDLTPAIYSPIDGIRIGRIRSKKPNDKHQYECKDEGIIIEGHGDWKDYEARIYHVQFSVQPGRKEIKVGDKVATRLKCDGVQSVFIELRYQGRLLNFQSQLTGTNCTSTKRAK